MSKIFNKNTIPYDENAYVYAVNDDQQEGKIQLKDLREHFSSRTDIAYAKNSNLVNNNLTKALFGDWFVIKQPQDFAGANYASLVDLCDIPLEFNMFEGEIIILHNNGVVDSCCHLNFVANRSNNQIVVSTCVLFNSTGKDVNVLGYPSSLKLDFNTSDSVSLYLKVVSKY